MTKTLSPEAVEKIRDAARKRWGTTKSAAAGPAPRARARKITDGPIIAAARKGITVGKLTLPAAAPALSDSGGKPVDLDPGSVDPSPFNRTYFDPEKMQKLVASVREHGVIQAGIARLKRRADGAARLEIVAGERRWHAAKAAGKPWPAVIRELTDLQAIELQAVENLEREDLNAIDEAVKYQQLCEIYAQEEGLGKLAAVKKIHEKTGMGESTIFERLTLVTLPSHVQVLVQRGILPASHAGLLTKLKDPASAIDLAGKITHPQSGQGEDGILSFRETQRIVAEAAQRERNLAAWQKQAQEFKAKGFPVLTAEACAKYFWSRGGENWGINSGASFIDPAAYCPLQGADYRRWEKLWKKAPQPILGRLPDGRGVIVHDLNQAKAVVMAGGRLKKGGSGGSSASAAERAENKAHRHRCQQFTYSIETIVHGIEKQEKVTVPEVTAFWRFFARCLVGQWRSEPLRRACKRRGIEKGGYGCPALKGGLDEMAHGELRALCVEILLYADTPNQYGATKWGASLSEACGLLAIPLPAWNGKGSAPAPDAQSSADEEDEP